MLKKKDHRIIRYIITVALVLSALKLTLLLAPLYQKESLLLLVFAVTVSAFLGGSGAGIFAILLSVVLADYFLISTNSFLWQDGEGVVRLGEFVLVGLVVSALVTRLVSVKDAEEKLSLHHEVADASSNGIVIVDASLPDNPIIYVNPAFEQLTGYKLEEVKGHNCRFLQRNYTDQLALSELRAAIQESKSCMVTLQNYRKDGTLFWNELHVSPVREDGFVKHFIGVLKDTTGHVRSEEPPKESEVRFRYLVRHGSDIITILNADGTVQYGSTSIERMLGYDTEELVGESAFDYVHPDDLGVVMEAVSDILAESGNVKSMEFRFRHKEGSWRCLEAVGSNLLDDPNVRGIVVNSRDITERKRAEDVKSRQIQEAALRNEMNDAFSRGNNLRSVLETCTEVIVRRLGITLARIRAFEGESNTLKAQAGTGSHIDPDGALGFLPLGNRVDVVDRSRDSYISNDIRSDPEFAGAGWVDREGLVAAASYPLLVEEQLIGDLTLFSREPFPEEMIEVLSSVAQSLAQSIQRKRTEDDLRESLGVLLALREAGYILGSTLEQDEIVSRLLQIMRRVSDLTATIISMPDENGQLHIWRSVGVENLPTRIRYAPEAERARQAVLKDEEKWLFRLESPTSKSGYLAVLCLPIRVRDRFFGVLEAYGSEALAEDDIGEILGSLTSQAASALENARLYRELGERERRLQDLVGKLLGAQEEERRRVAYEVHDGLAQVAVAAHQRLQAFARRHQPEEERARDDLERVLELVRLTVSESRRIIAHLRPTTLDDLGLTATISLEVEGLREEGYSVDYEENLVDERLPSNIEIALYRAAQETLTNVRKHAQTKQVSVKLLRETDEVRLEIQDHGVGFDPETVYATSGPGERVGLAGMHERVSMVGGKLEINSHIDKGTSTIASVPI